MTTIEFKTCSVCGEEKPLTEYHYAATRDTYYGRCKVCVRAHNRARHRGEVQRKQPPKGSSMEDVLRWYGWDVQPNGCWLWKGPKHASGYGNFAHGGKKGHWVHRVAYECWVGPIPEGLDVRHKCDTPLCMNPECLVPGTHAQNMLDKVRTGRADKKLNAEEVQCIRDEYAKGVLTQRLLAEAFGIAPNTVSQIVNRKARVYV